MDNLPTRQICTKSYEEFSSKIKSNCSTTPSDYPFSVTLSNTQTTTRIDLVQTINAITQLNQHSQNSSSIES